MNPAVFESMLLERARVEGPKDGPGFFGLLFDGQGKTRDNATALTALALDFDDLPDHLVEPVLESIPYFGWMHTTWTHQNTRSPKFKSGHSRLRIILPLSEPLEGDSSLLERAHVYAVEHIKQMLPHEARAKSIYDNDNPFRFGYLPKRAPGASAPTIRRLDGQWLSIDPKDIPQSTPQQVGPKQIKPIEDEARLIEALGYIPPNEYEDWVTCGLELRNTHGDDAFHLWERWSSQGDNPDSSNKLWKKWQSFKRRRGKQVRIGTIFDMAKKRGWTPTPTRRATAPLMANPFEGQPRLPLDEARDELRDLLARLIHDEGLHLVGADTETGKTTSILHLLVHLFDRLDRGQLDKQNTYILTFPTDGLCRENLDRLLEIARAQLDAGAYNRFADLTIYEAGRREADGPSHCPNYRNAYWPRESTRPGEGAKWCFGACEFNALNEEGRVSGLACQWSRNAKRPTPETFIIIRTHQMHQNRVASGRLVEGPSDRRVQWASIARAFGYEVHDGELISPNTQSAFRPRVSCINSGAMVLDVVYEQGGRPGPALNDEHLKPKLTQSGYWTLEVTHAGRIEIARWLISARVDGRVYAVEDEYEDPLALVSIDVFDESSSQAYALWRVFQDTDKGVVVIHDEDITKTFTPTINISWDDLHSMMGAGLLTYQGAPINAQHEAWAHLDKWRRETQSTHPYTLQDAELAWPDIRFESALEDAYESDLLEEIGHGRRPEHATSHEQRSAIKEAIARCGQAVIVHPVHGLQVLMAKRMRDPRAHLTILLDATAHEEGLRALHPDLHAHHIRADFHEHTQITRALFNMPRAGELDKATDTNINARRYEVLHTLIPLPGPKLHITRKLYTPDRPDRALVENRHVYNTLLQALQQGDEMTHLESDSARGSNQYEDCQSAISDSWYVPGAIIKARAQLYAYHSKRQNSATYEAIARWGLEGAPVLQALQRTRARGNARSLIYCAPYDLPGLTPTTAPITTEHLDILCALCLGFVGRHYVDTLRTIVPPLLEQVGPLVMTSQGLKNAFSDTDLDSSRFHAVGTPFDLAPYNSIWPEIERRAHRIPPSLEPLLDWIQARGAPEVCEALGVEVVERLTSKGHNQGPRWLLLPNQNIEREQQIQAARDMGASWIEIDGERVQLVDALEPETVLEHLEGVDEITWATVCEALGEGSRRSARRKLEQVDLPSTLNELRALVVARQAVEALAPIERMPSAPTPEQHTTPPMLSVVDFPPKRLGAGAYPLPSWAEVQSAWDERRAIQLHEEDEEQTWRALVEALRDAVDDVDFVFLGRVMEFMGLGADEALVWLDARGGEDMLRGDIEALLEREAIQAHEEAEQADYERTLDWLDELPLDLASLDSFIVEAAEAQGHEASSWLDARGGPVRVRMDLGCPTDNDLRRPPPRLLSVEAVERWWSRFTPSPEFAQVRPFTAAWALWRHIAPELKLERVEDFQEVLVLRYWLRTFGRGPCLDVPFDRRLAAGLPEEEVWARHVARLFERVQRYNGSDPWTSYMYEAHWALPRYDGALRDAMMEDPLMFCRAHELSPRTLYLEPG